MTNGNNDNPTSRPKRHWPIGKLISLLLVLAAAAAVLLAITVLPAKQAEKPPPATPPVNVTVMRVEPIPLVRETYELPGVVQPDRVVCISAEVAGRIERLCAAEGKPVRAGQELVCLNTDLLRAEYDQAKARAEFDRREYARTLSACGRGAATTMELDQARTQMAASEAALAAAKARLERATITAPVNGILDELPVEAGEYVVPGAIVAKLVDVEKMKVLLDVPERDVPYLAIGQVEEVFLVGRRDRPLKGRVSFISRLADRGTHTTRVELTVDNSPRPGPAGRRKRPLHSGQIVRVRLTRRVLRNAIMIPLQAVIPLEDGKAVYVVEGGKARRRRISLGFIRKLGVVKGWRVRVVEGLSAGDVLIVAGHRYVAPGQAVKVTGTSTLAEFEETATRAGP